MILSTVQATLLLLVSSSLVVQTERTVLVREGRRIEVLGGIDFSQAEFDPESGKRCVDKEIEVDTLTKKPVLECTHR